MPWSIGHRPDRLGLTSVCVDRTVARRTPDTSEEDTPIPPPRRYHRGESAPSGPRINDRIRISPIRLIDQEGSMVGVVDLDDAKRRATEAGLDLVEISADVRPPVCRIMDYGKFKYEKSKSEKANKSKAKVSELKEVRMGRSMKIDPHDIEIRIQQARRFLLEGHKVQIIQNFRGREIAHKGRGDDRMQDIMERLGDLGKVEMMPRLNGRRMIMILGPDKAKVEQYKRLHPKPTAATLATKEPDDSDVDDQDLDHEVETGESTEHEHASERGGLD